MPTYEYACGRCGHEFERFHSILAEPVRTCPKCGKNAVTRKIGIGGAVLFKGGGFYETDYRSESYAKAAEAEKAEAKPKDGEATKPDARPNAQSDAKPANAAKDAPKPETKTGAKEPAPKPEPASKATHRSRVGRGIGNIVQNPPKPQPKPKTTSTPKKSARRK